MYQEHTTKEGDVMLICEMSDGHLYNYIRMVCKKIYSVQQGLTKGQAYDPLLGAINPNFSKKNMEETGGYLIKELYEVMQPYVMEACLRQLDISNLLQTAFNRKTQKLAVSSYDMEFDKLLPPVEQEEF